MTPLPTINHRRLREDQSRARQMDRFGWDTLWLAEHHFQLEGYEALPNLLRLRCTLRTSPEVEDRLWLQHRAHVAPAAWRRRIVRS
jgi:alkanesulfonate monooxygenase SsuD/methylene tetrahydromethanopterin reductase-like flavin-dependent oxidoreductase (luciferase family)